jgi:hypothetical protein
MFYPSINRVLKDSFLYQVIKWRRDRKAARDWERDDRQSSPPHVIKERVLKEYAERFQIRILLETGTYLGEMVDAMKTSFDRIFSIELDPALHKRATERFASYDHISLFQGDSGEVMKTLLVSIDGPCLFWLDGHFSGGITAKGDLVTPIMTELAHILNHPVAGHVILIDDARLFAGENDYPTLAELRDQVFGKRPGWKFRVEDDIIRIHESEPNLNRSFGTETGKFV